MTLGPFSELGAYEFHGRGTADHQRVLADVNRMREGVRQHEVNTTGHAAANGERRAVIDAALSKTLIDNSCGIGCASGLIQGGNGQVNDRVNCQAENESTLS